MTRFLPPTLLMLLCATAQAANPVDPPEVVSTSLPETITFDAWDGSDGSWAQAGVTFRARRANELMAQCEERANTEKFKQNGNDTSSHTTLVWCNDWFTSFQNPDHETATATLTETLLAKFEGHLTYTGVLDEDTSSVLIYLRVPSNAIVLDVVGVVDVKNQPPSVISSMPSLLSGEKERAIKGDVNTPIASFKIAPEDLDAYRQGE